MIGLGTFVGDVRDAGLIDRRLAGRVDNNCAGSSKSFAQKYLLAIQLMQGRGVGFGTDMNGLPGSSGPRFGPFMGHTFFDEDDRRKRLRRTQAEAQRNGVRYTTPIIDYRFYRFEPARTVTTPDEIYSQEERDIWEAIAIYKSGVDPERAEQPGLPRRTPFQRNKIVNIAKGFRATNESQLLRPNLLGIGTGNSPWEQRAAFLVKNGRNGVGEPQAETRRLYGVIGSIWRQWHGMEGPNIPLSRSTAGRRDFDINIDGFAHYGMFPDFIQDLKNVGLRDQDLAPLFRSAEDFIQVWEKSIQMSQYI
jgi:hypothetical protein